MISRLSFTYPSPSALSPFQNHSLYPTINCWVSLRLRPRPFPSFTLFLIPGASHLYAQHLLMPLLISPKFVFPVQTHMSATCWTTQLECLKSNTSQQVQRHSGSFSHTCWFSGSLSLGVWHHQPSSCSNQKPEHHSWQIPLPHYPLLHPYTLLPSPVNFIS